MDDMGGFLGDRILGGRILGGKIFGSAAVAVVLAAFTAACAGEPRGPAMSGASSSTPLPAGAILVGEDLYMVPIGKDETGCPQFRMHSPTKAVPQVIYYADGKGGYTMNRAEAACSASAPKPSGSGR